MDPLDPAYLDTPELAERWGVSARTIEGWRRRRKGPAFIRIGSLVRYSTEAVETYEQERLHESTAPVAGTRER
jgi:predicted DNA-binding transcriptional regulator AlpA